MRLLILAIFLLAACDDGPVKPKGLVSTSDRFSQLTPRGARVESENGVTPAQLEAVDRGIARAIADGITSGYPAGGRAMSHPFHTIRIPVEPCRLSPFSQTPSFLVLGNNYDGSVYDQYNTRGELPPDQQTDWAKYVPDGTGVIYAAELALQFGTPGSTYNGQPANFAMYVVCPDASVLENGARFGAEHAIVANHDAPYFTQTMTHSVIGHPILPKR